MAKRYFGSNQNHMPPQKKDSPQARVLASLTVAQQKLALLEQEGPPPGKPQRAKWGTGKEARYGAIFGKWDDDCRNYVKNVEVIIGRKAKMADFQTALSRLAIEKGVKLRTGRKQRLKAGLVRSVIELELDTGKVGRLIQDQSAGPHPPRVEEHPQEQDQACCPVRQAEDLDEPWLIDDEDQDDIFGFGWPFR